MKRCLFFVLALLLIAGALLPALRLVTPVAAQDATIVTQPASQRYGFSIPATWVSTSEPVLGLQLAVPSEVLTLADSQTTLAEFTRHHPTFFFEEYDYDYRQFRGAVIATVLWPQAVMQQADFPDDEFRYELLYIGDDYEDVQGEPATLGAFSGVRYSRTVAGILLSYFWLQDTAETTLLVALASDAQHRELAEAVLATFDSHTPTLADLNNPAGPRRPLALATGLTVEIPAGWWTFGIARDRFLTLAGPNADLLGWAAFRNANAAGESAPGVVVSAYSWDKSSLPPDALSNLIQTAAQVPGINLTLESSADWTNTNGLSGTALRVKGEARLEGRPLVFSARAVLLQDESTVTALAVIGSATNLLAFEPVIDLIFATARQATAGPELRTVTPLSGRYTLDIPANWFSDTAPYGMPQDLFYPESLTVTAFPGILTLTDTNILARYDLVSYDSVPPGPLLISFALPASIFLALDFTPTDFELQIYDDLADEGEVKSTPLEGAGASGTQYAMIDDTGTARGYAIFHDSQENLYFFQFFAGPGQLPLLTQILQSFRLSPASASAPYDPAALTMPVEIVPGAIIVDMPLSWWVSRALGEDYDDPFEDLPARVASPNAALHATALEEPEDWPYDLPGLRFDMLTGVAVGGVRFDDLSAVEEFMRSDGSLDVRLLALFLTDEFDAEDDISFHKIAEWRSNNDLTGTIVEFQVELDIELAAESGSLDAYVFVVIIAQGDVIAVVAAITRTEDVATYRPIIEAILVSARPAAD